jgi:[protein-PII] uridylyltransferase
MSDFAQKRDLADPATVAAFTRIVENPERLRLLLILTVADIRAVGPGVWNGWKGQLLRELFGASEAIFRGGRGGDPAATFARHLEAEATHARAALIAADAAAASWAAAMENAYFTGFSAEEHLAHAALARRAAAEGAAAAQGRIRQDRNAAEITVTAHDRRGLFANLTAAISAFNANVVGARAYTSRTGLVLDVFYVQDAAGMAYGCDNPRALDRLIGAMAAAARGEPLPFQETRPSDGGRSAAFAITPTVAIDNEASGDATVIEISGRDRPGLLGALARTLAEAGLSIQSAHVDNYGERAVDVFYCYGPDGGKLDAGRRIGALKSRLAEVLDDDDGETLAGRPKLERARANVGR